MLRNCILFVMLIAALPAICQVGELRNNFSVGFNAGVNYNNVSFSPKVQQGGLLGYGGGLTARYISEKYFAMICGIQVELNFTQRGWKELIEDINEERTGEEYSRTMNYLEIPFLAHLAFGRERGARFFINLGPQIAFLLNEKEKYNHNPWEVTGEQYDKKAEKKFDYGIVGGLGMELRTKAGNFLLEGRYYFGLADIFGNSKVDYFGRSAHTSIMGRISYLFDLKK